MSGTADHLGLRKTQYLHDSIIGMERARRRKLHPHEHAWIDKCREAVPEIAAALVSGWVGQGRVAVRFVGQQDKFWHMFTYPYPHTYLGVQADPWTDQSSLGSSPPSDYKWLSDHETFKPVLTQTNTT